MGDKKPKKNSSGNSDAHKAKLLKRIEERPAAVPKPDDQGKGKKK